MNYRRRHNQRQQRESSFLRNLRYEAPKEGLGKLLEKLSEWGGAFLGLVAGATATRRGLPLPTELITGAGVVLGAAAGAGAKAAVTAALDTIKARRASARVISVGDVSRDIEQIIDMLDRNHQAQLKLLDLIRDNHARLATVLAGASPGLLQRINGQFGGARRAIEEACSLVRLSQDSLRGYLRTIGAT